MCDDISYKVIEDVRHVGICVVGLYICFWFVNVDIGRKI